MALTGDRAMRGGRHSSATIEIGSDLCGTVTRNLKSRSSGMANGLDWAKYRKSSVYKQQLISSDIKFIHWSRKIPIGDGFHEFV